VGLLSIDSETRGQKTEKLERRVERWPRPEARVSRIVMTAETIELEVEVEVEVEAGLHTWHTTRS